jgi:hypothetical protein
VTGEAGIGNSMVGVAGHAYAADASQYKGAP